MELVASLEVVVVADRARCIRAPLPNNPYYSGWVPFGKANELADFSRLTFVDSRLPARDIPRHCTEDELAQDPDYARSQ